MQQSVWPLLASQMNRQLKEFSLEYKADPILGVRLTTKWSNDSKGGHGKGVSGGASSAGPLPSVEQQNLLQGLSQHMSKMNKFL